MKKFTDESMSEESRKMLKLLVNGGVIGDANIQEEKLREFRKKKLKNAYHNTELLMKNYRNIAWLLECFPDFIAAELDEPFENIDKLIDRLDVQLAYGNQKVENRLESLQKTRLVIDKINEALSIVKTKPNGGNKIYDVLYMTYVSTEQLTLNEVIYRLGISRKHYYRLRNQGLALVSLRLWSSPKKDIDFWVEMLMIFENKENKN